MKTLKIISFILTGFVILNSSCVLENIEKGDVITEARNVNGYNEVEVENAIELYLTQGDSSAVVIEANSGLQSHIITEVTGNKLRIYYDRTLERNIRHHKKNAKAYVTVSVLEKIIASGASIVKTENDFVVDGISVELSGASQADLSISSNTNFLLKLSGASTVDLTSNTQQTFECQLDGASIFTSSNFKSETITINASGASRISIQGNTTSLYVYDLSGASTLESYNFQAISATIDASGASKASISVSEQLGVSASGASIIKYMGTPRVNTLELSGASQLIRQ